MKKVILNIDGKEVESQEGMTILAAARSVGIQIPTLCYHEKLTPYGGCGICTVEISRGGKSRLVLSCIYIVEDGLVVKTQAPRVVKHRKMLMELLLASSPVIADLARQYGVDKRRFEDKITQCVLCGRCVRYCNEIKKANAIAFVGRGINRRVAFVDEAVSKGVCLDCRECFGLCPTGKLPRETDTVCFDGLTIQDVLFGEKDKKH
jgi:bidirectional [NiFe] hydrogenase diaphorase subunit